LLALAAISVTAALRIGLGDWGPPSPFAFYPRGPGYVVASFLFDTLVWKDENGIIPWLAVKWELNSTHAVFVLREARWSDGRPLTAEDVVFTFRYIMKHGWHWKRVSGIKDVYALDNRTVVFELRRPQPFFLESIASTVFIIPKHVWEDVDNPYSFTSPEAYVGSGPYVLESYSPGRGYELKPNPHFWGPKPKYELEIAPLDLFKPQLAVAAVLRGEVDAVAVMGKAYKLVEAAERAGVRVKKGPMYWVLFLGFNLDKYPYNLTEFRRAVSTALNLEELVRRTAGRGAIPGSPGYVPPYSDFYVPVERTYDPALASALLDSLGIADVNGDGCRELGGEPWSPLLVAPKAFVQEAIVVREMLRSVGICMQLKVVLGPKQLDMLVKEGRFDMEINGHGAVGNDPLAATWWFERFGTPWKDPRYKDLVKKILSAETKEDVYRYVEELQLLVAEEVPRVALYYPYEFALWRDGPEWFFTHNGIDGGIPLPFNKLALLR